MYFKTCTFIWTSIKLYNFSLIFNKLLIPFRIIFIFRLASGIICSSRPFSFWIYEDFLQIELSTKIIWSCQMVIWFLKCRSYSNKQLFTFQTSSFIRIQINQILLFLKTIIYFSSVRDEPYCKRNRNDARARCGGGLDWCFLFALWVDSKFSTNYGMLCASENMFDEYKVRGSTGHVTESTNVYC